MKQKLFLTLALVMAGIMSVCAQVTIGSEIDPGRVALLDLKTRQAAGVVNTVGDDENISSDKGGLLLPRVKLVSTSTLQPFIPITDADWTNAAKQKALRMSAAGLMVYNIASVGTSLYPGLYTWDGEKWTTSQANPSAGVEISVQPKAFTFYETGTETVQPLTFEISGAAGEVTYQWYQVTGNNLHVRVGTEILDATTASYTPSQVVKGTTKNANNTGYYRFYCVAKDSYGKVLESDIAEIAVGCGAKNNLGEWISFMCFNLGASEQTIAGQIGHPMTFDHANDEDGKHYYIADEEQVYGDLYQWGRIGDGHEKRGQEQDFTPGANTAGTNQAAYGTGPAFEDGEILGTGQRYPWRQVARSTEHYGKFILTGSDQNYNWAFNLPAGQIDQLWRTGRFAPNDPCAKIKEDGLDHETYYPAASSSTAGGVAATNWRMPSQAEWGEIYKGGALSGSPGTATANTWVWNSTNGRGMEIKPDGKTTTLFLPASGNRSYGNGLLYSQGSGGYYWSTTVLSTNAYSLTFYSGSVYPAGSHSRGLGFALRCIKN